MPELNTAERDRLYTAAQDEDWLASLYLLGLRDALMDPARARELTGMGDEELRTYWRRAMLAAERVADVPDVTAHMLTDTRAVYGPPRSLEQRIVGASHAEGAE